MARREWVLTRPGGEALRIKKRLHLAPGETYQDATGGIGMGVIALLQHNPRVAREIYADIQGISLHAHPIEQLDEGAWMLIRAAFEEARYVLVPLHPVHGEPHGDWAAIPIEERYVYLMTLLVDTYGYSVNGAAGILGNLAPESGLLPDRLEQSRPDTPLLAPGMRFNPNKKPHAGPDAGPRATFTADEIMNRRQSTLYGPWYGGIGLAQWTDSSRRKGLFHWKWQGRELGASIVYNMDAQLEYLVHELKGRPGLDAKLRNAGITVDDACDSFAYDFETPGSMLDEHKHRLPRTDPHVQAVFTVRRPYAHQALNAYRAAEAAH
jgi:Phage tail lysozyme